MKFHRTLHAKIFTIFFTTTILIILSIIFFARSLDTSRKSNFLSIRKNLYVHLLSQIDKIGVPPNIKIAESVAKELDLKIGISGPGVNWKSDPSLELAEFSKAKQDSRFKDVRFGHFKGRLFAILEKNGFIYFFEFQSSEIFSFPYRLVIGLATIVIIILLISFIVTRWVMKPVRPLVKGVEELSNGNFSYRIQFQQNDEFGFFANIFNNMAQQIQQMLKAKDKLLLDVSHELRSPLGRMKVASEMVKEEPLKSSLKEDLHEMEFMVDEILERYRLNAPQGALKLERINLVTLLEELTGLYKTSGVGVFFRNTLSGEAWIKGDIIRLKKALTNLIENGIKYSENSLSPVELALSTDAMHYLIEVIDRGTGMKESELSLIFEPFYKIDQAREKKVGGYGLGLSICKDIINAHSGKISVSSQKNAFTRFTVILPKVL
ncbi:MAG: sensor histidine kinase [Nitrospiria bacterium]